MASDANATVEPEGAKAFPVSFKIANLKLLGGIIPMYADPTNNPEEIEGCNCTVAAVYIGLGVAAPDTVLSP